MSAVPVDAAWTQQGRVSRILQGEKRGVKRRMATLVSCVGIHKTTVSSSSGTGKYHIAQNCRHHIRGTRPFSSGSGSSVVSRIGICDGLSFCSAFRSGENSSASSSLSTSIFRRSHSGIQALADKVASELSENIREGRTHEEDVEDQTEGEHVVNFNWEEQWYPLYLVDDIPGDAPLALSVYNRLLVVYRDGEGKFNCLEDRCPHRTAKLSEGHIIDGKIECLYHGWQFEGDGTCSKIPQLPPGATIPKRACARSYAVKESQGVLWVWMGGKSEPPYHEIPYFDSYDREGFQTISSYNEFPYDASILLENLMDPAHIHISHDRTDQYARRENAQAMAFEVTERSAKGFSGLSSVVSSPEDKTTTRFIGPCVLINEKETPDKKKLFNSVILVRSIGQGRSALIIRFGAAIEGKKNPFPRLPPWVYHLTSSTVLEQDMGFLCAQNEVLVREQRPTGEIYLNMRSQDRWVEEYRKWLDKVGHGMPHYWGYRTLKLPPTSVMEEAHPAGLDATIASTTPSKVSFIHKYARDPTNRYVRHGVHCKSCRGAVTNFEKLRLLSLVIAALSAGAAIVASRPAWRIALVVSALLMCSAAWGCKRILSALTENYIRPHKITP